MADQRTLNDRTRSADIRQWAAGNGFEVSARGKLPAGVIAAYEAAQDTEPGKAGADDSGPDWTAAAAWAADAGDPLAGLEAEPDAAAGAAEPETPPPPASLDEARERAGGQQHRRRPPWAGGQQAKPKPDPPPVKVTASVRSDIEGKLALLLSVPAMTWQMADPYCGGAFADNAANIASKMTPLICQSPDAVRWFTKGTTFILWMDLAVACQPVATAIYRHHLSPEAQRAREAAALQGAQQQYAQPDLSAYTTMVQGHVPEPRPA